MDSPDKIKNINILTLISFISDADPTIKTISHENNSTTIVRRAVARFELTFRKPILARIAVIPANPADKNAKTSHIKTPLISSCIIICLIFHCKKIAALRFRCHQRLLHRFYKPCNLQGSRRQSIQRLYLRSRLPYQRLFFRFRERT